MDPLTTPTDPAVLAILPPALVDLIQASFQLALKIRAMDAALTGQDQTSSAGTNPVASYHKDIRQAFAIKP